MRSTLSSGECTEPANQPNALAVVYYEKANTTAAPGFNSRPYNDTSEPCANDALTVTKPYNKVALPKPDTTVEVEVSFAVNATGHLVWTIDNSTYRGDLGNPLLLLAKNGQRSYKPELNVYDFGTNSSVRVVLNNKTPTSHPWHLHAHEM